MESDLNKVDQGRGGIGGKPKRQNAQAQAKKHAQAKQKAEPRQLDQPSNEAVFRERFGPHTIRKDWSLPQGLVGAVLKQKKDYCWAIVLARLMQAAYNQGRPIDQQIEFSFLELVAHIMPKEDESFALTSFKIAFDHIAKYGMMKKPLRECDEKASAKGLRIKETFEMYEDVDAAFIQAKLDKYPVGLILESTPEFGYVGEETIYYLPKKKVITPKTILHSILLIGYGVTRDGKLYFIGQNSWGNKWGCRGYVYQ